MKPNAATIQCPSCKGTGQKPLSNELKEVLALIKGRAKRTTPELLMELSGVTSNALNNRLDTLVSGGFLERKRNGRWFEYFRPSEKKEVETATVPHDPTIRTKSGQPKRNRAKKK